MSQTLRLGVVGTGRMAARMMHALPHASDIMALGVASSDVARAQGFATEFGLDISCGSASELALRDDIDALYVAGRTQDHAAAAMASVQAGKPVLTEKPLATNMAQASDLIAAAKQNSVLIMENLWCLALPAYRQLAQAAASGDYGAPRHLEFAFGYPVDPGSYASLFDPADGGALRDRGVYGISLALSVLGPVADTQAIVRRDGSGVDLGADLLLRHESGATSHIAVALDALLSNSATLSCTGGSLQLEPPVIGAERLRAQHMAPGGAAGRMGAKPGLGQQIRSIPAARRLAQHRTAIKAGFHSYGRDQYAPVMTHFADLVRSGKTQSDLIPTDLSRATQAVIDAALKG